MLRSPRGRVGHLKSLALITALAITTGWTVPSYASTSGNATVDAAASAPRVAAAVSVAAVARDDAFDGWAEARARRYASPKPTSTSTASTSSKPASAVTTSSPEKKGPKAEASKSSAPTSAPTYRGTNHFWIPSLGMSYNVHWYGCGQTFYPKNYIYRWGCAGKNNIYLLGHAHSVMKPLHDLYVSGRLRVGMVAIYADAKGRVTKYRVTEWRVVRPTQIAWQIAAQPRPSMTLQTCVGKDSQYRLNVRLVSTN
jgi:hypothetical protein